MGQKINSCLDTNALVRFFTDDNQEQQKQVIEWFREAQKGRRIIVIEPIVIAETSFVLESFYKEKRVNIVDKLETFLGQRWLKIKSRRTLISMLEFYKKGFHFVDSFLLASAKLNNWQILSFDKKLLKIN